MPGMMMFHCIPRPKRADNGRGARFLWRRRGPQRAYAEFGNPAVCPWRMPPD
jgi:hypothetical protein